MYRRVYTATCNQVVHHGVSICGRCGYLSGVLVLQWSFVRIIHLSLFILQFVAFVGKFYARVCESFVHAS